MPEDQKLSLNDAAQKLGVTPEELKQRVASGQIPATGSGDQMTFDPVDISAAKSASSDVIDLDDEGDDDFTLKLTDEGEDTDMTASITPPPTPSTESDTAASKAGDTNVFGDDTVDLMDTAGVTDTIELTEDSIAGDETDSLLAGDTLAGSSDTLGTDTLMAADSLAETGTQETFLGADILEGLSGDTTAEITTEVRGDQVPVQYVMAADQKSPVVTFMLVFAMILMVLTVLIILAGASQNNQFDPLTEKLVFSWVRPAMGLE